MTPPRSPHPRSARRASVYIMVLGLVLMMMAAGAASIAMSRARARTLSLSNDTLRAEALAESALEYAITQLRNNPLLWRTLLTNNSETPQVAFAGGKISYKLVDETDGNLNNGSSNPVRVYGIGRFGSATQCCSAVVAGTTALSCLNAPLTVGRNLYFNQSVVTASGATVAANGNMTDSSSGTTNTLTCNLEAGGTISLQKHTVTGTQLSGLLVTQRDMPSINVFDYYVAKGVTIPITALPVDSTNGGRKIENVVLSPASNPFTSTLDADGVYVIPCNGTRINIMNCRIVGTLVLLYPGTGSCVGINNADNINWSSAVTNFPCLLVKGDFSLVFGSLANTLIENAVSTNFNPPGTPYPYFGGATNTDTSDSYPSMIDGLVYISGNLTGGSTSTYPRVDMLIVGGDYDAQNDNAYPSFRNVYTNFPPPGFTGNGTLSPIAGTYRKELAP